MRADSHPILRSLAPSLSRASFLTVRGEANRRGAVLLANIKAYQQQYGVLPESLDLFRDKRFSIDPFTGRAYRYQLDDQGGFRLYSTGGNGVDHGGVHDPTAEENDFVIWPRPRKDD